MKSRDQLLLEEAYKMVLVEQSQANKIQIFADGRGSDFADKYTGAVVSVPVESMLANEPFKDRSYMETSENIKNMIAAINKGQKLPPIKVVSHPYDARKNVVVDGNHRMYAFQKSNVKDVEVIKIPHKDVLLMKSEYGTPEEYLGTLDKFANDKEVADKYFVKPDGTNIFKPVD